VNVVGLYEITQISVRSMNITTDDRPTIDDQRPTTDLRANSHILGTFQTVISLQRIIRFTVCMYADHTLPSVSNL